MPGTLVTPEMILIAQTEGLINVEQAVRASQKASLPFWAACALLEKETGGGELWGGADASPFVELNKLKVPITEASFRAFYAGVKAGLVPTGVGPCQITYAGPVKNGVRDGGYFRVMLEEGLKPWNVEDNMYFGFRTLWGHYLGAAKHTWRGAGRIYNGSDAYGVDLLAKCEWWKKRLGIPGPINP